MACSLPTSALGPEVGSTTFAGAKAGIAAASWIAGGACGTANDGTPDTPFLEEVNCGWSGFTVPDLPAGAVITRIYPVLFISNLSVASGMYVTISAGVGMAEVWNNNSDTIDGQNTAPGPEYSLGSTDADITGAYVNLNLTARTGPWPGGADISSVALAVYYTVPGGGPPSNQTQVLELSGGGLALPPLTVITGVEVNFETGLAFGSAVVETAQLTVGGTPVGTPKPLTPGAWPSPASLGGNGDLWGQESMLGAQANELGVNFGANLNAGSQLNLNDVSITVFYETKANEEGTATLVYDIRAKGFIFDQYDGAKPTVHAANEGESQQGTLVGCVDGTLRLMESDSPEVVTGIVLSPAMGEAGWATAYEGTFEYSADSGAVVWFVAADAGNGSYASNPIILPGTGGEITKFTTKLTPNKWKLLQVQFESTDQTLQVYLEGCVLQVKSWGSDGLYEPISIFRPSGGRGAQG